MSITGELNKKKRFCGFRRKFLQSIAGMGLIGLCSERVECASITGKIFTILDENDRFDIGSRGDEIIQAAYKLGYEYEKTHGGCARCSVGALQDSIDFIPENKSLLRAASCLDGGATPTKIANCGAFTGPGMVIGWICGTDTYGDTALSHKLIRKVHERFEKEYGSVICKDIRGKIDGDCKVW